MTNKPIIPKPIQFHLFIIILLTTIAYSNSFSNSFHFDDRYAIFEDTSIRDIGNIHPILKKIWDRPVLRITFALNYYFSEFDLFGFHLVNLLLHIAVSLCVYFLAGLLFKRFFWANPEIDSSLFSLMSGLIFALHPIQTGSVTYIASRSAVLATLFYLVSLILFISGLEKLGVKKIILHFAAFFSFAIGITVKEIVLTAPIIIVSLYLFLVFVEDKQPKRRDIIVCGLWLMIIPGYVLAKYLTVQYVIPVDPRFALGEILPPYQYLLTELNVIVFHYLKWLLLPYKTPHTDPDIIPETSFIDVSTISASIIIICLIYIGIRCLKKQPIISFAIFWYFITLIPTSSIFPLADTAVERHLYLPSAGIAFLASFFLVKIKSFLPSNLWFIPYLIPCLFVAETIKTNFVWKNEITLWEDAAIKSPNKARVLSNRAFAYFEAGDMGKAESFYADFLKQFPFDAVGNNNMGLISENNGDITSAIKYYKEAIRLRPDYWLFYMHLGEAYSKTGLIAEAINEFQKATDIEPSKPEPLIKLASILLKNGEFDKVIRIADTVLFIEPKNATAFSLLGISYEKKGLKKDAIYYYKMALKLNPELKAIEDKIRYLEES